MTDSPRKKDPLIPENIELSRQAMRLAEQALLLSKKGRLKFIETQCKNDLPLFEAACRLVFEDDMPEGFLNNTGLSQGFIDHLFRKAFPNESILVGPYRVEHQLGSGKMGAVFLVRQTEPPHQVYALKFLKPPENVVAEKASLALFRRCFAREVDILRALDHPNVVGIHGYGEYHDRPYLVMDYFPGRHINTFVRENALSPTARLQLFMQVCDGVAYIHQRDCLHRDLKPSNIMARFVGRQMQACIIDFGFAKNMSPGQTEAVFPGYRPGTPLYMAPECMQAGLPSTDVRADIYALGCVLYQILCDQPPYQAFGTKELSLPKLRELIMREPLRLPRDAAALGGVATDTLRKLDKLIQKATHPARQNRFSCASELRAACEACLPVAVPPRRWFAADMQSVMRPTWAVGAGGCFLVFLGLLFLPPGFIEGDQAAESVSLGRPAPADRVETVLVRLKTLWREDPALFLSENEILEQRLLNMDASPVLIECYRRLADNYLRVGREYGAARQIDALARLVCLLDTTYHEQIFETQIDLAWRLSSRSNEMAEPYFSALRARVPRESFPFLYFKVALWHIFRAGNRGDVAVALTLARQLLEDLEGQHGVDKGVVLKAERYYAQFLARTRQTSEAERIYRRLVDEGDPHGGNDLGLMLVTKRDFALFLMNQGRFAEARYQLEEALSLNRNHCDGNAFSLKLQVGFCLLALMQNRPSEACELASRLWDDLRAHYGPEDSEVKRLAEVYALALASQGNFRDGLRWINEVLDCRRGPFFLDLDSCRLLLNKTHMLVREKKFTEAGVILDGRLKTFEHQFRDYPRLVEEGRLIRLEYLDAKQRFVFKDQEEKALAALELAEEMLATASNERVRRQVTMFKGSALARLGHYREAVLFLEASLTSLQRDPFFGELLLQDLVMVHTALGTGRAAHFHARLLNRETAF